MLCIAVALACLPLQTREERVLELVRGLELLQREIFWYRSARFVVETGGAGEGPVIVPRTGAMCGNRLCSPEAEATRALGRELFAIYGLDAGGVPSAGAGARLDGFDAARRVGFELLWGELAGDDAARRAGDSGPEELVELRAGGARVHVASLERYVSTEDDRFTPTLAYLVGLVEFLNGVTEGEDVALGGLVFEREATLAWPSGERFELGTGVRLEEEPEPGPLSSARVVLRLDAPGRVCLRFAGAADFGPPKEGLEPMPLDAERALRGSTRGAPSVLAFSMVKLADGLPDGDAGGRLFPAPVECVRVVQPRAGAEPLVFEGRSLDVFLPGAFDLAQPFDVELALVAGRYRLNSPVRVGAAAPR